MLIQKYNYYITIKYFVSISKTYNEHYIKCSKMLTKPKWEYSTEISHKK